MVATGICLAIYLFTAALFYSWRPNSHIDKQLRQEYQEEQKKNNQLEESHVKHSL